MSHIKSYTNFITEADDKEAKGPATVVDKIKIPDSGAMKTFEIGGKKYKGVISTFKAIGAKQKAMGEEAVGVITLPGQKDVYELFLDDEETKNKEEQ